jgi:hypothetical protein
MVQYYDEPFALWWQVQNKGKYNEERLAVLLNTISDWNLFLAFNIIDGCTEGKSREPLPWLFREVQGKVASGFTEKRHPAGHGGLWRFRGQPPGRLMRLRLSMRPAALQHSALFKILGDARVNAFHVALAVQRDRFRTVLLRKGLG